MTLQKIAHVKLSGIFFFAHYHFGQEWPEKEEKKV